ncbi:glycoside hydrolase family 3 N-terminal domain-containing protein [Glaciimonas sp. PCH181]|uniref:glycoside hydrolase family 3 N-terminal domain-containing protein n=1 Tax=Glaciimonas sp. PCH181 TaxID=2133943 RepID=UPI000D3D109C|nr:glycoside hydrolase family 3 N-terminal domain-containing protein [Glaciimonas sp. PCH181]PUA18434.1 glycoside hydrolase [Glaciimonas sp. PCH181]
MDNLSIKAHSVLLPAMEQLHLGEDIQHFLDNGGKSLLFGETGNEYVNGKMDPARLKDETLERWHALIEDATRRAGPLLKATDADISAVHRLEGLTPPLPSRAQAQSMSAEELEAHCLQMALAVKQTGINLVLSPTADVVDGHNVWLNGRTLADDPGAAAKMVRAYVRGVRRAGLATTLKHFPGHPMLLRHPANEEATVTLSLDELRSYWAPFRAGIEAGVEAVMMGPAIFNAVQPPVAASISPDLISLLRGELNFKGLVITCDLDHKATIRDATLGDTAVAALKAGADLLLLSPKAVPKIREIVAAIVSAVQAGQIPETRLDAAVAAVLRRVDAPQDR